MKKSHEILGAALTVFIAAMAILMFINSYGQVWDKWIEKADTVNVYSTITINGKEYFAERALFDDKDYVLVIHRMSGNTVIYVDKKTWFKKDRGSWMFIGLQSNYDRTYGRIYDRKR